jgi:ABC-type xylose transport system permease subunit
MKEKKVKTTARTRSCDEQVNKTRDMIVLITIIVLSTAFVIMLHQWITWGHFWDIDQVGLHHETVFVILMSFGMGLVLVIILMKRRK